MIKSDDHNLLLVESIQSVDQLNAKFYGRFPYPWTAAKFDYLEDPYFETRMVNQELGDWGYGLLPKHPRIWVAGCGTNQAVLDLFNAVDFLSARICDAYSAVEFLVDVDVDIFVDCRADDRSSVAAVEGRQVAASTDKTHPQGGATNDHAASNCPFGVLRTIAAGMLKAAEGRYARLP